MCSAETRSEASNNMHQNIEKLYYLISMTIENSNSQCYGFSEFSLISRI